MKSRKNILFLIVILSFLVVVLTLFLIVLISKDYKFGFDKNKFVLVEDLEVEVTKIDSSLNNLPVIPDEYLPNFKLIKTIEPSDEELDENNRARSAKLRVIERVK